VRPVIAAFVLLTVALIAMWQQGSVQGIGIVTGFIVALAALESGGLTRRKADQPDVDIEIEKGIERIEMAANIIASEPVCPDGNSKASELLLRQAEAERRLAIDRILTDAVTWGWLSANAGSPAPPVPLTEWDEVGRPRIVRPDPSMARRQARARRRPEAFEKPSTERQAAGPTA
jgi:hypothetical protein